MSKIVALGTKIYKPEILDCPFCRNKLSYKHTISNKVVQFSSAKKYRIRNLGYGCLNCNDGNIYFSQTAAKMCFKGYTYSTKIVCLILHYKNKGFSRDEIYPILSKMGIVISERNIDNIYNRFSYLLSDVYKENIYSNYEEMYNKYKSIRLSIDVTGLDSTNYVCVRNYFTAEVIGLHKINLDDEEQVKNLLSEYLSDNRLTHIVTIRKQFMFHKLIKQLVDKKVVVLEYAKF